MRSGRRFGVASAAPARSWSTTSLPPSSAVSEAPRTEAPNRSAALADAWTTSSVCSSAASSTPWLWIPPGVRIGSRWQFSRLTGVARLADSVGRASRDIDRQTSMSSNVATAACGETGAWRSTWAPNARQRAAIPRRAK